MGVASLVDVTDSLGEAVHLGLAGPVGLGQVVAGTELVRAPEFGHRVAVDVAHELPPAQHLPDGTLGGVERDGIVGTGGLLHRLDNLHRVEQTDVDARPEQGVRHRPVVGAHRVLVRAKLGEPLVDELAELSNGLSPGHRPRKVGHVGTTPGIELPLDPVGCLCCHRAVVVVGERRRLPLLGGELLVLVVVVPLATDRIAVVHQHTGLPAHPPVERLVAELSAVFLVCPLVERLPGADEQLGVDQPELPPSGRDELLEPLARAVAG